MPNGIVQAIRHGEGRGGDTIEQFTGGIRLNSGREPPADIIITATGLNLQLFGGGDGDYRRTTRVDITTTMA